MKSISKLNGIYLYDLIRDYDNCLKAVKEACKDHKHNPVVLNIKENAEEHALKCKEILDTESFHYTKFHNDLRWERGKLRDIWYVDTSPDRIIQHAVFNILTPILHGCVISQSYAGVKNRGIHKGIQQISKDLQDYNGTRYCLKMDIKGYFKHINRNILFQMVCDKISCKRTIEIMKRFIFEQPGEGLLIGLFSSQILGVFYLYRFGHYCKENLRIKYFYIYMDDIVVLNNSKNKLHAYQKYIKKYLNDNLELDLKTNYAYFPIEKRRLDFMGYVFDHKNRMIRKRTKINYKRSVNNFIRAIHNKQEITPYMVRSISTHEGNISKWCSNDGLITSCEHRINEALVNIGYIKE